MSVKLKWGRGILHKILQGPDAGLYLPFGLSRLRQLERITPEYCFSQRYKMPGYDIHVEQCPPVQYVKIVQNGDMYFEFATSGNPVVNDMYLMAGPYYKSIIVGVDLKVNAAGTSYTATPTIAGQKRTFIGVDVSPIGRSVQVDLIDEPVAQRGGTNTFESWAPKHPWAGVLYRSTMFEAGTSYHALTAPISVQAGRDAGYDVPHGFNYRIKSITYSYLQDPVDWPRAAAVQTVTDKEWGQRKFAVYVDAKGTFSVYPVGPITAVNLYTQNILAKYVQTATPSLPTAVFKNTTRFKDYAGTAQEALYDLCETDWKFNHKGDRACAVMMWRTEFAFDSTYFGLTPTANPLTLANFNHVRDNLGRYGTEGMDFDVDPTHHNPTRYYVGPGIIELRVGITLTGPNPEDYTFKLDTNVVRDGTTTPYCSVVAGYCWYDIKRLGVKQGDLIVFDLELYSLKTNVLLTNYRDVPNRNTAGTLTYEDRLAKSTAGIWSVKNLSQKEVEIWSLYNGPLLAVDFPTLSCAFQNYPADGLVNFANADGTGVHYDYWMVSVWHALALKATFAPTTYSAWPAAVKNELALTINTSGRVYINSVKTFWATNPARYRVAAPGAFTYASGTTSFNFVPLNDPARDTWANTLYSTVRHAWAGGTFNIFGFRLYPYPDPSCLRGGGDSYRTGAPVIGADTPEESAFEDTYWRFSTGTNNAINSQPVFMSTTPLWGQHAYADYVSPMVWLDAARTFYAHQNGSWAYWDTNLIFDANGQDRNTTITSGSYDVAKVEQCYFDKVHIQSQIKPKATLDTTFLALYNAAVTAGTLAGTLEVGISTMAAVDMKAVFTLSNDNPFTIQADWDGSTYNLSDDLVFPTTGGDGGKWQGACMTSAWGGAYPAYDKTNRHIRYAQPILIEL